MEDALRELRERKCRFSPAWLEDLGAVYEDVRCYMQMLYQLRRIVPTAAGEKFGLDRYFGDECNRLVELVKGAGSKFGFVIDDKGNLEKEKL
jgi:hypothetical protein